MLPDCTDGETLNRIRLSLCMAASAAVHSAWSLKDDQNTSGSAIVTCQTATRLLREFSSTLVMSGPDSLLTNLCPMVHVLEFQVKLLMRDPNLVVHVKVGQYASKW